MDLNIFLIGFMGTGKTTIGMMLAEQINAKFIDLDSIIEERTGKAITGIFETYGEEWFRKYETEILKECIAKTNNVISTGGGIILNPYNVELMKNNGIVIALKANMDTIWERLKDTSSRPLLKKENFKESLKDIYQQRTGLYDNANFTFYVDERLPEEIVKEIIQKISLFNSTQLW